MSHLTITPPSIGNALGAAQEIAPTAPRNFDGSGRVGNSAASARAPITEESLRAAELATYTSNMKNAVNREIREALRNGRTLTEAEARARVDEKINLHGAETVLPQWHRVASRGRA
jgi:hypothetical protein